MFYELIYTRCRLGMDISKKGQSISTDGYKVYACTPAIMDDGVVDLPFFANAAQTKQSYNDPGFMDDAYLYYVPDIGASFLLNFYPIPFNANANGDYSHRPGNFINQVFTGDFSEFYPFEMFKDKEIWNAKARGEAYYYGNESVELPSRNDINDPPGQYNFEDIDVFITDGRKEALAAAVSFLITQYKLEPGNRKFLVIRDDSSEKIELWIAAIEYAFSPRMASGIPFATRMDKFVNANRYTVNQFGTYQVQINLQDPNQRQRYRAMIVGVDERDQSNANSALAQANSPFVLLDGKEKKAMFEADISDRYYQLITKFDEEHQRFCREFLQSFDITTPSSAVFPLYGIFKFFDTPYLSNSYTLAEALVELGKYKALSTSTFIALYKNVNKEVSRFLQEDLSSALAIINWLQINSRVIGDQGIKARLSATVCDVFLNLVWHTSDSDKTLNFWAQIKSSEFAEDVAKVMTDIKTIQSKISNLHKFSEPDMIIFVKIYLECATLIGIVDPQNAKKIVGFGLGACYRNKDQASVHDIVTALSQNKAIDIQELLLSIAKGSDDDGLADFLIDYMTDFDSANSAVISDKAMLSFCKKLRDEKLEHFTPAVLYGRLGRLSKISELEQFIEAIKEVADIKKEELKNIFESIDKHVSGYDKKYSSLAKLLQSDKPLCAVCKNSAHVYVLEILSDERRCKNFMETFDKLKIQGFPSIESQGYIDLLTKLLFSAQLNQKEQVYTIQMFKEAPPRFFYSYSYALCEMVAKAPSIWRSSRAVFARKEENWNNLITYIIGTHSEQIGDMLVKILVDSKQSGKSLDRLVMLLNEEASRDYFDRIADKAWKIISTQKSQSTIGGTISKLFKRGKDGPNPGKKK